jgi:RHS repeat-associated protein
MIDNAGSLTQHIRYTAFGRPAFAAAVGNSHPYTFAGRVWDAIPETLFCRARVYSPELGRFLAQDPLGFESTSLQLYEYANNMPTWYTDPAGRMSMTDYVLISTVMSAVISGVLEVSVVIHRGDPQEIGERFVSGAIEGGIFGFLAALTMAYFVAAELCLTTAVAGGLLGSVPSAAETAAWNLMGPEARARAEELINEATRGAPPGVRQFVHDIVIGLFF